MELIVFKAKTTTSEELEMVRQALIGLFGEDSMSPEEIQKLKKSERNKKDYQNRKLKNAESAESDREEREEKEAGSSPLSPSSPSSSPSDSPNNIPITPYNPPLPEEKGEREERVSAKAKPAKNHHGEYQHVLLTADEFFKLQEKFGWDGSHDWIRRLDEYLENNQKKHYDSHYLTILNWARKDEEKQQQPIQQPRLTPSQIGRMLDEMEQKKTEQVVDL